MFRVTRIRMEAGGESVTFTWRTLVSEGYLEVLDTPPFDFDADVPNS